MFLILAFIIPLYNSVTFYANLSTVVKPSLKSFNTSFTSYLPRNASMWLSTNLLKSCNLPSVIYLVSLGSN